MNTLQKISVSSMLALGLFAQSLFAQAGNDNPAGTSGSFNGEVTTGCSYDPYTGNAKRTVTDLVVAGSVGSYPLAFGRTSNSRYSPGLAPEMGQSGAWRHSYQWNINDSISQYGRPNSYTLNYSDGAQVTFSKVTSSDPYFRGPPGQQDRLKVLWDSPSSNTGTIYLCTPDGGKIWFDLICDPNYTFVDDAAGRNRTMPRYYCPLRGIIDPYGQTTTITTAPDGLSKTITEPAGRWIKLFYSVWRYDPDQPEMVIDHVTASDGRTVQYTYDHFPYGSSTGPSALKSVQYFGDSALTATYTYQNPWNTIHPLLGYCDDPMYAGPMRKISYVFAPRGTNPSGYATVEGQLQSEKSGTTDQVVSTLEITSTKDTTANVRKETRADGKARTFTYNKALLHNWTDFRGKSTSQERDAKGFVKSITNRKGYTTDFTNDSTTGNVTTTKYPETLGDAPAGRGLTTSTYGGPSCPDTNNRDLDKPDNPTLYVFSVTDEGGNITKYWRYPNKQIRHIDYADGGAEDFTYNSFGQVETHRLRTGGLEKNKYDDGGRGLLMAFRDPYHLDTADPQNPSVPTNATPNRSYTYDAFDRVKDVTDVLGSTTSQTYNDRGQTLVTTLPVDPIDGHRYTITNEYNSADGTLKTATDARLPSPNNVTSYFYDDYRRLRKVIKPGHDTPLTAQTFYDPTGMGEDYTHTDANVTHSTSTGGKQITNTYDENYRKISTIVADGTSDAAKTSSGYDDDDNVTSVISPNEQPGQQYAGKSTISIYDERDRLVSIKDALNNTTTFTYDAGGRKKTATRADGQIITYDIYDVMNRLLQQTVTQAPDPDAITKYSYYTSGLLHSIQDPRLVSTNSSDSYSYIYDLMGRKTTAIYPADSGNMSRSEGWHLDTAGRIDSFTNRNGDVQTFIYDTLSRQKSFSWNDGLTPSVSFDYDVASRIKTITNANATISRTYFNDSLLNTETTTYADNTSRMVTYSYNDDSNRQTIQYPNNVYSLTYGYTDRNQLKTLSNSSGGPPLITYSYDPDGNLKIRAPDNSSTSSYIYDALGRVTGISHGLNGTTRTLDYGYDVASNRKWTKREGNVGDVFGYDLNDQSISALLNVPNPSARAPGAQTINYDANGNRNTFAPYGSSESYVTNSLNEYVSRTIGNQTSSAIYDYAGNMTTSLDNSTYSFDAQNRLLSANKDGTTEVFKYDGLNRQVSRKIGSASPIYNVFDGWDLIAEYAPGSTSPLTSYARGSGGVVKNLTANLYYYQDANGSTCHLADNTGHLLEWYRYDLHGRPIFYKFYNSVDVPLSASSYDIRHLFTGQQWHSEVGLYDLRKRFYSPDIGRFIHADPIGFGGDATNLYRYCGNNPLTRSDPTGELAYVQQAGNVVTILVPIRYSYGPGISPSYGAALGNFMNQSVNRMWSGQIGGYQVRTIAFTADRNANANEVTFVAGTFRSEVKDGHLIDMAVPGLYDYRLLSYYFAHEAGHFMGAIDNSEARDIMASIRTTSTATKFDIEWILFNRGNGAGGRAPSLSSPGNYFSGRPETNSRGQIIGMGLGGPTMNRYGGSAGIGSVQGGTFMYALMLVNPQAYANATANRDAAAMAGADPSVYNYAWEPFAGHETMLNPNYSRNGLYR